MQPLLSVITVVYNNAKDIERTIRSVVNQTYHNIEYIVIDGASNDGTMAIIHQYKNQIAQIISEPDKGIYDAMNKGLKIATGDYVLFMNSGDEFFEKDTVQKVFSLAPNADIYYGETEIINEDLVSQGRRRHQIPKKLSINSFKYGMSICHQAIYIKKSLTGFYNSEYKLSADIDWILSALSKAKTTVNAQIYVAKYLIGGQSKQKHRQSLIERYQIFKKYYGFLPNIFHHLIIAIKLAAYWLIHRKTND
jgi:glycosyltransferase involved in cell wall biosynthesis